MRVDAEHACRGVRVELTAGQSVPGDRAPGGSDKHPLGPAGIWTIPTFCRRDDYMLLPPEALGGLPCLDVPSNQHFDPYDLAVRLAAAVPPPELRIMMNPAKGMVAVPTWFWVEGYDGGTIGQSQREVEKVEKCHFVPVRGADGRPLLDSSGRPRVEEQCTVESTTFDVSVRLWPSRFHWDFGDKHAQDTACRAMNDCGDALGQPYIDFAHPSPVQHPYIWSSLGANGIQDAYTIKLDITFAADFEVRVNGHDEGGWRSLLPRTLTWTTLHKVQEAQAVLVRPCPVTVDHC